MNILDVVMNIKKFSKMYKGKKERKMAAQWMAHLGNLINKNDKNFHITGKEVKEMENDFENLRKILNEIDAKKGGRRKRLEEKRRFRKKTRRKY